MRAQKGVSHDTEGVVIKGVKIRPILEVAGFSARGHVEGGVSARRDSRMVDRI